MDHHEALLIERVIRPNRTEEQGPIPELVAKRKLANQLPRGTAPMIPQV